jgi:GNAT superfamily N-acetyltransferase
VTLGTPLVRIRNVAPGLARPKESPKCILRYAAASNQIETATILGYDKDDRRKDGTGRESKPLKWSYRWGPLTVANKRAVSMFAIEKLETISQQDAEDISRIYAGYSAAEISVEHLRAAASEQCVLVARMQALRGKIVGFVTLVTYRRFKGRVAQVEDIVVHEEHRKCGVGSALLAECVRLANEVNCLDVHLATYPNLEAANCFYEAAGWTKHNTNTYKKIL